MSPAAPDLTAPKRRAIALVPQLRARAEEAAVLADAAEGLMLADGGRAGTLTPRDGGFSRLIFDKLNRARNMREKPAEVVEKIE
ncbi:MAG: hypothetical protein KGJ66_14115 [Alphaproteobacteria bacterium]|nr:hypothetical protein [Alphaproteobacteria bacterium]